MCCLYREKSQRDSRSCLLWKRNRLNTIPIKRFAVVVQTNKHNTHRHTHIDGKDGVKEKKSTNG